MSESKIREALANAVLEQQNEILSKAAYDDLVATYREQARVGRGFKGKVNLYTCKSCGSVSIWRDMDAGVTPFGIRCLEADCNGDALSSCYKVLEPPAAKMRERKQWYRPGYIEYTMLPPDAVEHVNRGGLLPRDVKHD